MRRYGALDARGPSVSRLAAGHVRSFCLARGGRAVRGVEAPGCPDCRSSPWLARPGEALVSPVGAGTIYGGWSRPWEHGLRRTGFCNERVSRRRWPGTASSVCGTRGGLVRRSIESLVSRCSRELRARLDALPRRTARPGRQHAALLRPHVDGTVSRDPVPFLDHVLVEWAASVPDSMKVGLREQKRVLRHAARDLLPTEVLERRKVAFFRRVCRSPRSWRPNRRPSAGGHAGHELTRSALRTRVDASLVSSGSPRACPTAARPARTRPLARAIRVARGHDTPNVGAGATSL